MAKRKVGKVEKVSKVLQASKKEPQTMEELLAQTDYQVHGLKRGQMVSGLVTQISGRTVLLDIGAKTEGIVADREFEGARDFIKTLKIGDRVSAQVFNPESEAGQILLSLKKTASSSAWRRLGEILQNNEEIEGKVLGLSRTGLLVETHGLTGFVPTSQLGSHLRGQEDKLLGQKIKTKIIEVNEGSNRLILSERAVSEKEKIAQISRALGQIKVGKEYSGVVTGVTPFGVFVQISSGPEGLVHISEVSWGKVEDLKDLLPVGQEVKVRVIEVDKGAGKLALSLKQLQPDPWLEQIKSYPVETKVSGRVTKLTDFGIFVELEPGLEGFLHLSKMPAEKKFEVGETIDCFVEAVDTEKRRLSLGLVLKAKPVGYK